MNAVDSLLVSHSLDVRRGPRRLINALSFSLGPGQMALVVGPNGCGKTSLLRVLAGLSPPAAGRVSLGGTEIHRLAPEQRAEIAYRGHLDGLKKDLSIAENLDFYERLASTGRARVDGVLAALRLDDIVDRQVRFLSAGQRRRAALAALKLGSARLWILDEPMTNLDPEGRKLVGAWIAAHLEEGGIAVVATHQAQELMASGTLLVEL